MTAPFTPEQEARVREIVSEALMGVERHRAERVLSHIEADIEFGVNFGSDRPSAAQHQGDCPAEGGSS